MCKLDKTSRKAVVLGMLAVIRDRSGSRNTFQYRLDWCSPVCRDAFCAVIGISCRTLKHWLQQVCSDSDVEPLPMATVAGHLIMPCLVWTRIEWSHL